MDDFVTRAEHTEFAKRMEEEHIRMNKRVGILEDAVKEIADLAVSVKELATNMKHMVTEQERQGRRLETIESRDGEHWRKAVSYVLTAIGGALIAYLAAKLGIGG